MRVFSISSSILSGLVSLWVGWVNHCCLLLSSCHWSVPHKAISWRLCTIRGWEAEIQSMALSLRETSSLTLMFTLKSGDGNHLRTSSHRSTSSLPTHQFHIQMETNSTHWRTASVWGPQRRDLWSAEAERGSAAEGWTWASKLIALALQDFAELAVSPALLHGNKLIFMSR